MPGQPQLQNFNSGTLTGAEEIVAGFSSHIRVLAKPLSDEAFDGECFRQVQYDTLVIEDLCSRQVGCAFKPVETEEIQSIVRSLRVGKLKTFMD